MEYQNGRFRHNKCHILRLPIELQIQIFTECMFQPFAQLEDQHQAPQMFLSVCRNWRDLAYATPSLWSSFELCFGTWSLNFEDPEGDAFLLSRMKLWLRRSGNYALSVKISYETPVPFPRDRKLPRFPSEALTLLMPHCSRMRNFELSMPSSMLAPLLEKTPKAYFPLLERLVLNPIQLSLPSSTPELLDIRPLASSCGQLTRLHINLEAGRALTLNDCAIILSHNPNLTSCSLYAQCILDGTHTFPAEKIELPVLTDFHLMVYSNYLIHDQSVEAALMDFLGTLELYALKSLNVEWFLNTNRRAWSSFHPAFVSFLESLKPTLETLRLAYIPMSEEQMIDCMRAVPYLTSVELLFTLAEEPEGPVVTDTLWKALTIPDTTEGESGHSGGCNVEPLLPLIESINLQFHGSCCSERELVHFVDSRADAELDFHSLKLRTRIAILHMNNLERELSLWRQKGIEVYT